MRVAHTAFGGLVALAWLLLPTVTRTAAEGHPPASHAAGPAVARVAEPSAVGPPVLGPSVVGPPGGERSAAVGPGRLVVAPAADGIAAPAGESSGSDLVLPLAAAGTAVAVAAYSLVRRRRRARLRTTPTGAYVPPTTPLSDLHHRARRLLVETDDSIRTSTEELTFAARRPVTPPPPVERSSPAGPEASPEHTEAEPTTGGAREPDTAAPGEEYPSGVGPGVPPVAEPFVEALADARRELVAAFKAGQRLDDEGASLSPDEERALLEEILTRCTLAQRRLDTATPAFDQLRSLERDITPALEYAEARFRELTGRTATAATTLTALRDSYAPAASRPITGHVEQAKDRLVFATTELNRARQAAYPGDLDTAAVHLRAAEGAIDQADLFVTGVERLAAELARATERAQQGTPSTAAYDEPRDEHRAEPLGNPLDALRRRGRRLLPSRSAVEAAADFITTHRAAVGVRARTRLSEAERHLAFDGDAGDRQDTENAEDAEGTDHRARRADALAQEARDLAEQDVRAYGNPYGGPVGDGLAGAVLGGIILGEHPDGPGRADLRGPACYGGTATRARRAIGGQF